MSAPTRDDSGQDFVPNGRAAAENHDPRQSLATLDSVGQLTEQIPDIVIRRLPVYVRTLRHLSETGICFVSSDDLAERIGVTAAQIRRDLSYFGKFGKQGKGYDTVFLADAIASILNLDRTWEVALAGYGNLGRAVVSYRGFVLSSFNITAIFDPNPEQLGEREDGITIYGADEIASVVERRGIRIGIIAVPASAAQKVADQMTAGGVRAILNYAPVVLKCPEGVIVRDVDPVSVMQSMTFYALDGPLR